MQIQRFIEENTARATPPLVPEIELLLTSQSLPIWEATEEFLAEKNVDPPYWAFAWAGGQALARYILDNPHLVLDRRVLDLGSGSGLTAIAAARAGAAHVTAADIDPIAARVIEINASLNEVQVAIETRDILGEPIPQVDVVLVGDLFYERGLAERVLAFVSAAQDRGAVVLAGDPGRNYFPYDRFAELAIFDVPVLAELEDRPIKPTKVWRLLPQ